MEDITANLDKIRQKISECEQKFGRQAGSVQLLAASKKQSIEKMWSAIRAGQSVFGENYLQEALPKMHRLTALAGTQLLEWHYIGPIQTNKTKKLAEHFDWVQSVSDSKIADRLNKQRPITSSPLNICIEVNVDEEPTKSGVRLDEVEALVVYCQQLPQLRVRGLMAIPKIQHEEAAQRAEFHKLWVVWDDLKKKGFELDTLSIGMTEDYPAAIAEGSTMVRIGTGIFGPRE